MRMRPKGIARALMICSVLVLIVDLPSEGIFHQREVR